MLKEMNYKEARDYLKKTERLGSVLGLDTIRELLRCLGNPEKGLKVVHIAGTNGKGSVLTFLESILLKAGYRTGQYHSPAVFSYREIIQRNGENISRQQVAQLLSDIRVACEQMVKEGFHHPTVFEMETAMAFLFFAKNPCDIVLIECLMGGAEDATNVFEKVICSVITSISLDHTAILGNSLPEIAKIKAGIMKENCPVVMSKQKPEVFEVIKEQAEKKHARYVQAGQAEFLNNVQQNPDKNKLRRPVFYESGSGRKYYFQMAMAGTYQLKNAATAIETAELLESQGYQLKDAIGDGLENAVWPGRMELVSENPVIYVDGAHNPEAVQELKATVDYYFTNLRIDFIIGVLADKDFEAEARLIAGRGAKIYTITPKNKRALNGEKLAEVFSKYHSDVVYAGTVSEALKLAANDISEDRADMILAFGSLTYLGELKEMVKEKRSKKNCVYLGMTAKGTDGEQSINDCMEALYDDGTFQINVLSHLIEVESIVSGERVPRLYGCVELETFDTPSDLREKLDKIQKESGGCVEIEILMYGKEAVDEHKLAVPSQMCHENIIWLELLCQIAPDTVHPIEKKTVSELLDEIKKTQQNTGGCAGCCGCPVRKK